MTTQVDSEKIKQWRKERFWSQEKTAEKAGISLRTIQRIEKGGAASDDSMHALAATFDVNVAELVIDQTTANDRANELEQANALVGLKMSFGIHALGFVIGMLSLLTIDVLGSPGVWVLAWPMAWWTIGFLAHGAVVVLVQYVSKMQSDMRKLESAR